MADVSPAQNAQEVVLYDTAGRTVGVPERPVAVTAAPGATQPALDTTLQATNTSLGTDGAGAPAIQGTGVRGWLRALHTRLGDGTQRVAVDTPLGLEATQQTLLTRTTEVRDSLGTDGANPGTLVGTGARGWMRRIAERLEGTLVANVTDRADRALGVVTINNPPELASFVRVPDLTVVGTVQAVGSTVVLPASQGGLSAFTALVEGFTTGSFVIERTLSADPAAATARWDAIRTFRTGSYSTGSTWTAPGAFYSNIAAATGIRVRVVTALSAPTTVRIRASAGTSMVSVGAIASNEGNIIGGTQSILQVYATAAGGRSAFNATSNVFTIPSGAEIAFATLVNPAASGVDVFLSGIHLGSSASVIIRRYRNSTLTALPTPASAPNNRGGGTNTGQARLYTGPTRSGGNLGKVTYVIGGGSDHDNVDGTLVLRPGENCLWTVAGAGGLGGSATCAVEAVWWEQAAVA